MQDLDEAIALNRAALELRQEGHPHHPVASGNLMMSLSSRFRHVGSMQDLDEAIARTVPPWSFKEGNINDFEESIQFLQHATAHVFSNFSDRLTANLFSLLQRALSIRPTLAARHQFLSSDSRNQAFALDAASCAIEKGDLTLAIETPLEQLSQASKLLADRFEDCSHRLEALMVSSESREIGSDIDTGSMPANNAHGASVDAILMQIRQAVISEIRELPGFKDFLRAAPFESLKEAASEGPVVVLNHSKFRCDVLIVASGKETPCVCVPLGDDFYTGSIELYNGLIQRRKEFGLRSKKYDLGESLLRISSGSRIWWCPTSILSALPFHAAGPYKGADGSMKYLLDDYISSYTPTLTSLINARSSIRNGAENMCFVADTKFPSSKKERGWIRRSLRRIDKRLLDDHATPEAVLKLPVEEPFNSSLKLLGGKPTLLDIVRANLPNAEFAFLSACHTAERGPEFALDEILHMAAAMQFCGFRSVVGTMWKLLDREGPSLARFMYRYMMQYLEEGEIRFKRAAAAVREAARRLRDQDDAESPRRVDVMAERWANPVHIGA
ncbi:TPR-like protein [Sanghuangporus baumii]|uniref:TPR-like protein n=1 Tax=Sanghuangporus baumii TaxID=108892 RepID=A0A9Q5HTV7_SANBA|nr:TPR-like protein [Sanghuangporus baumii]